MSDSGQEPRDWRFYVEDMIEFAEQAAAYAEGLDKQAFTADARTYDATLRNIELIGEAATHVPEWVREAYPEIEWRQIVATRNRVAHAYLGIDQDVIWTIVQSDIPDLLAALRRLLDQERA